MGRKPTTNDQDAGAAMMAWYADAIQQFPDGLVSQAQAATMLGVSRVAVSRLVNRGYLRAVYFPKPPDVAGLAVGKDDPTWIKIMGWFGGEELRISFPKAAYVSFGDVVDLWQSGEVQKKCARDWEHIMAGMSSKEKRRQRLEKALEKYKDDAEEMHRKQEGET